jgi:hypothetical protein
LYTHDRCAELPENVLLLIAIRLTVLDTAPVTYH